MNEEETWVFNLFGHEYQIGRPSRKEVTDEDREQLYQACVELDKYHGLPEQLQSAFEQFIQIQSAPLFYAGMTVFSIAYAYMQANEYDEEGLAAAYNWLEKAQAIAPDEKGVLLASFDFHLAKKEYKICQEILQRGKTLFPRSFDYHKRHLLFLTQQGTVRQIEKAFQDVRRFKLSDKQKATLLDMEAYAYVLRQEWSKAIKCYKRLLKIEPNNPWFWHNLSIAQLETKNGFSAFYSNRKALGLMDFPAARIMEKSIRPVFLIQIGVVIVFIIIIISAIPR